MLDLFLTGKENNRVQAIAIKQLRQWASEHPLGDSISFRCESVKSQKQFRVWSKWFLKHEDTSWKILTDHQAFFYHKTFV